MNPDFLDTATQAMGQADGLDALGWWDLLPHLDDPEARDAVFAACRAQGRRLADTPALGALVAWPTRPGAVAALGRTVVGDVGDREVVPGGELVPLDLPGAVVHELAGPAQPIDPRGLRLGRIGAAAELLGAAEAAVDLAVAYAGDRVQFGNPIGSYQAVRHLLAWATTDLVAVEAVLDEAIRLGEDAPGRFDEVLKALAGRNARRACERSLQVLGGIGFTAEHDHHKHHSRVLLLDAVLGSSAELTHGLGAWLRTGADPRFASAVL